MISLEESVKLGKVIGRRYVREIIKILEEFGVTKPDGSQYSDRFISHVFNGRYANQGIEMAFYELYDRKLKEIKRLDKKRQKIANKKPEAATPGSL